MAGSATAASRPKRARGRSRGATRRRGWLSAFANVRAAEAELLLVIALFGAAMLARWPYLLRLPHFTDEIGEIRWALGIFNGDHFPLTAQVKYFGPLNHYILAICFWIFGPSITLPRLVIATFGSLTVVLTYLVGRELGGWKVGALGAALLATLPQHIVVNSHVAWQNSTTPFYSTLAAYAVLRAVRALRDESAGRVVPRWARWLLLGGFVFGLVLQTHIGTVVLGPAFAGWWRGGCGGRTPPRRGGGTLP
ncbi:MAG: glycosyltransferase family 39 protein [Thermomicrobiales bacterium]